ncbi:hypothetical protein [Marinobacter subterrani]|uniref:hypothetical protein n=1 Tax=Marinobacter subterrani TaxID=1658765 RepID=UPI00235628AC|nr:hypothetical protein [Marinobacter subterrani]
MPGYSAGEEKTPLTDVTQYNNFYEFGTGKGDPARYANEMTVCGGWSLWEDPAGTEWRAHPAGCALEVWDLCQRQSRG